MTAHYRSGNVWWVDTFFDTTRSRQKHSIINIQLKHVHSGGDPWERGQNIFMTGGGNGNITLTILKAHKSSHYSSVYSDTEILDYFRPKKSPISGHWARHLSIFIFYFIFVVLWNDVQLQPKLLDRFEFWRAFSQRVWTFVQCVWEIWSGFNNRVHIITFISLIKQTKTRHHTNFKSGGPETSDVLFGLRHTFEKLSAPHKGLHPIKVHTPENLIVRVISWLGWFWREAIFLQRTSSMAYKRVYKSNFKTVLQ